MSIERFTYASTELHATVRTTVIDGEPAFNAADVCAILDIRNSRDAISRLDDDEKGVGSADTLGGKQLATYVTESGLYSLVFTSRKPEAKAFKRWITGTVLPAIRKTGSYSTAPALTELEVAQKYVAALERESVANARIAILEPKASYVDIFVAGSDLMTVRTVASTLGVGETWLRAELVSRGWIYAEKSSRFSEKHGKVMPQTRYSEYSDKKAYFQRCEAHDAPRFRGEVMHTLKITPAGAQAIARAVERWTKGDAA
ncbi:prophage antirepressor-like protein [Rhodococcus sp. 27YEA15]|uniref:BRO family protein n=1 Tax=Rhodococcus sp. 27YEA15 TaxID=3156259 RepID=UPI003C7D593C